MLNPYVLLSILVAIVLIFIGAAVVVRNAGSKLNWIFFWFNVALSVWIVSNYPAADPTVSYSVALTANKIVLASGSLAVLLVFLFVKYLVGTKFSSLDKVAVAAGAIVSVVSLGNGFVEDVVPTVDTYEITFGLLSGLYFISIICLVILTASALIKGKRKKKGQLERQIKVFQNSFITGLSAIIVTNAILPFVFGIFTLTGVGTLFSVFFVYGIFSAIIGHRLFDLKLIVARSLAYILSLGGIVATYGTVVLLTSQTIFEGQEISAGRQIFYVVMSVFAGLIAVPLRRYFDKLSNRLFYRDAYEAQAFLDELNKELVSNIDLEVLLHKCAAVIEKNLKPIYCVFKLSETAYSAQRVIGADDKQFASDEMESIRDIISTSKQAVTAADDLSEDSSLKPLLRKYDIAVLSQLSTDLELEGLGYLVLGPKKSGNPYNKQDLRMIEIITNELVIAIQNALRFEEIEKFNVTLQEKVDSATAELKRTNEKLKELDETKDEFISMASHQLRTPLTSVKGYLSMVLEGDVGEVSDQQRKMLDQAFISSQRMVYLIADLLNVSRLKTGKFIIDSKATNLADVVEGEVSQLIDTAKSRQLELIYKKPKDFPTVMLDETKIRQVMMNFIDNAIYYTPPGGKIEVVLEDTGKTIEYQVHDNGIGVPKNERHHLFNKFYRANNARKARPDGTGLGLFMAKKVIVAQGGAVIFDSEEGKGSTFGFSFETAKLMPKKEETNTETAAIAGSSDS